MIAKRVYSAMAATALMFSAAQATAADLESVTERASYTMGYNIGQKFSQDGVEVDVDVLSSALRDALAGKEPKLTIDEMQSAMRAMQDLQMAKANKLGEANKKAGAEFLAENAKKEGVVTTASGLQYKIITEGKGPKPTSSDRVSVHYRGTLIDGTEFDSSYGRNKPTQFGVTQVIKGWTEALMMMPEGSKWELYIPGDLAYGPRGAGAAIGPNSTLIFEVELLDASVQ